MNNKELHDKIKHEFKTVFPNGWMASHVGHGLNGKNIYIQFGLVDREQLSSKILNNDPVHHKFLIFADTDKLESNCLQSGISINPEAGSYMAMGTVKTKYRKTTGNHNRILKSFKTFFPRVKQLVTENEANIYQREKYDDKFFK